MRTVSLVAHFDAFFRRTAPQFYAQLAEAVATAPGSIDGIVADYDFADPGQKSLIHVAYHGHTDRSLPDDLADRLDCWFDSLEDGPDRLVYLSADLGEGFLDLDVAHLRRRMPPVNMREFALHLVLRVVTTEQLPLDDGRTVHVRVTRNPRPPAPERTYTPAATPNLQPQRQPPTKDDAQVLFDRYVTSLASIPRGKLGEKEFHPWMDANHIPRRWLHGLYRDCEDPRLAPRGQRRGKRFAK